VCFKLVLKIAVFSFEFLLYLLFSLLYLVTIVCYTRKWRSFLVCLVTVMFYQQVDGYIYQASCQAFDHSNLWPVHFIQTSSCMEFDMRKEAVVFIRNLYFANREELFIMYCQIVIKFRNSICDIIHKLYLKEWAHLLYTETNVCGKKSTVISTGTYPITFLQNLQNIHHISASNAWS